MENPMSTTSPRLSSPSSYKKYHVERGSGTLERILVTADASDDKLQPLQPQQTAPKTKIQYPMTLNDNGDERPINFFQCKAQFISVMLDVVDALHHLSEDIKTVHGDVSPNTMFINEKGSGVLVDWDQNPQVDYIIRSLRRTVFDYKQ